MSSYLTTGALSSSFTFVPPANRHEPRRAKSSTSDYSVTEFLAEFPDDAACLEVINHSAGTGQRSMFRALVKEAANK